MTEPDFDPRLAREFRGYADRGIRPVDAYAIAESTLDLRRGRSVGWSHGERRFGWVAVALLLAAMATAIAVLVGSRDRLPLTQGSLLVSDGGDIGCMDVRAVPLDGRAGRAVATCVSRPVFSADGAELAGGGIGSITIRDTRDGHTLTTIATTSGDAYPIAWSPDGRWLQWNVCPSPSKCQTTVGSADGVVRHDLPSPGDGGYWGGTAWSADGTTLMTVDGSRQSGDAGWLVGHGDGSGLVPFGYFGPGDPRNVEHGDVWALAPDGSLIAFGVSGSGGEGKDLAVVGLDGQGLRNLTRFDDGTQTWGATWAPDGRTIAITTGTLTGLVPHHRFTGDLWLVGLDGSKRRVDLPRQLGLDNAVLWSPDGARLAVRMGEPDETEPPPMFGDIAIVALDGSPVVVLHDSALPSWSADGRSLALLGHAGGQATIDIVNADGTGRRAAATAPGGDFGQFFWGP